MHFKWNLCLLQKGWTAELLRICLSHRVAQQWNQAKRLSRRPTFSTADLGIHMLARVNWIRGFYILLCNFITFLQSRLGVDLLLSWLPNQCVEHNLIFTKSPRLENVILNISSWRYRMLSSDSLVTNFNFSACGEHLRKRRSCIINIF